MKRARAPASSGARHATSWGMANAVSLWSDSIPGHFSAPALGAPRTPRHSEPRSIRELAQAVATPKRAKSEVVFPIAAPMPEPVTSTTDARTAATVRARKTTFRAGAVAPARSSLGVFVLIGFAVGLFAFAMMSFCLPDPGQEIAARAAKKEAAAVVTAPPVAEPAPAVAVADPVPAAADPAPLAVEAPKPARAHRRSAKSKKAAIPNNPYLALSDAR